MELKQKAHIMDSEQMSRALTRISHEIIEKNKGIKDIILVGIRRRGVPLAERIAAKIQQIEGKRPDQGSLDITFYRDDSTLIKETPTVHSTDIKPDISGRTVIIIDDVLYTGRTTRAALDALMDLGRPQKIMLAVLIDRGHRELPIRADFVGKNLPTSKNEIIKVRVTEIDGEDSVLIYDGEE